MRIVHVCRQYRPSVGGLEAVVEALARRQAAEGHAVTVVTLDRLFSDPDRRLPAAETLDGVAIVRIGFVGSRRYPIAPGVLKHVRGASVVHVHGIDFFYDFLALTRMLHRRRLVATTHGGFFHTPFAGLLKRLWFAGPTRLSSRGYGAVVACSDQDDARFRTITATNLTTIENGVDVERFTGIASGQADEMLYFGRFSVNKGLDDLLVWFAAVRAAAPSWMLTIAGGPDGMTVADLADQIAVHGLEGRVRIVESPSQADLVGLLARASVFVSASRYEGFGIAPIEAAAAGLFPVLRAIPPFARTVARLGTGLLTDFSPAPDAVADILAAVEAWRGRQRAAPVLDGFGWDRAAERYGAVYRDCCGLDMRRIGRVAVTVTDRATVMATFDRHVAAARPLIIAFCNAHTVNMAERDDDMAEALGRALVLNDGVGVNMASRMLFGQAFPENLNGTDLTPAILRDSARPLRIFVVGAAPGVAQRAADAVARAYPRHAVVGVQHGFFDRDEEAAILDRIGHARPDMVLLGMGHPRQELWAARHADRLPGVTLCVGALLDRLAGEVARAPAWVLRMRGEWLYRLAREPRRLARRYLIGNAAFLARVMRQGPAPGRTRTGSSAST